MSTSEIQSYSAAMQWISDRIDYEKIRPRKSSRHFRLERMSVLLEAIGSPQKRIPVVHIAGTKGKGTTAAILHSILMESGLKTGLFISPHLHRFEERMRVGSALPTEQTMTELVVELIERLQACESDLIEDGPTFFEIATLLAWMLFDRENADLAVLETGLGGRLDCTNVCHPLLTVITCIGLDHTEILGETLPLIATEKAGIIKQGVPCLTGADQPEVLQVFQGVADSHDSRLLRFQDECQLHPTNPCEGRDQTFSLATPAENFKELKLPLLGSHQALNAGMAVHAATLLQSHLKQISSSSIQTGVAKVSWPLRFEITTYQDRTVVFDAAHNPDSVVAFARTFRECFPTCRPLVLFGGSQDKDVETMLRILVEELPCQQLILSRYSSSQRSCDPESLHQMLKSFDIPLPSVTNATTAKEALQEAMELSTGGATLCVLGSIFFSAEVRQIVLQ